MYEAEARKWLLHQLQCPFQGQTSSESEYHCSIMLSRTGCPFGHRMPILNEPTDIYKKKSQTASVNNEKELLSKDNKNYNNEIKELLPPKPLVAIPSDVCVVNLLGLCLREVGGSKCNLGEHLQMNVLQSKLNLTPYQPEVRLTSPQQKCTFDANKPKKPRTKGCQNGDVIQPSNPCDDCRKRPLRYLLDNCIHALCEQCLQKRSGPPLSPTNWEYFLRFTGFAQYSLKCRVFNCNVVSHRVIPWPRKVLQAEQRAELLKLGEAFHTENTVYGIPNFLSLLGIAIGLYYVFAFFEFIMRLVTGKADG